MTVLVDNLRNVEGWIREVFSPSLQIGYFPEIGGFVAYYQGEFIERDEFIEMVTEMANEYSGITRKQIESLKQEWLSQRLSIQETTAPRPDSRAGYVYLLSGGGYYKIGLSKSVDIRIEQISPKLPFEIELIHQIKADDMVTLENQLHERFADKRVNGEWFMLAQEDIDYIKSL